MIIVTGGAGFIGSAFVWKLNQEGINDILIVDDLGTSESWKNLVGLSYRDYQHKYAFLDSVTSQTIPYSVDAIIHMGACSSTTEKNGDYLMENNYRYTQYLAKWALENNARFIYASSAATYGNGEQGFDDSHDGLQCLKPINRYGYSKHLFDLWAKREGILDEIVGLKFFNVFGPNEFHKEDMKSVVAKAYHQIQCHGEMKLFKSYKAGVEDGEQKRDFVYVKDCVDAMWWLLENKDVNGLFNLGTGKARSFKDLVLATFSAMNTRANISFIEMPESLQNQYQYFTEASMTKLRGVGYNHSFLSLEDAVADYVQHYLTNNLHLC